MSMYNHTHAPRDNPLISELVFYHLGNSKVFRKTSDLFIPENEDKIQAIIS